jgi:hypothetical protein
MQEPKQLKKSIGAHNMTLQKLSRFDIEFSIELLEAAMCSNYQGVVFADTAAKYAEWQKKRYYYFCLSLFFNCVKPRDFK